MRTDRPVAVPVTLGLVGLYAIVAGGTIVAGAPPARAQTPAPCAGTFTFVAPGGPQMCQVGAGVTQMTITAVGGNGALGGGSIGSSPAGGAGGLGGSASAVVPVTPGQTLSVVVGGAGGLGEPPGNVGPYGVGGFDGGGTGGDGKGDHTGGGGGGASMVSVPGAGAPLVIAGGGGGGGNGTDNGVGSAGGAGGEAGTNGSDFGGYPCGGGDGGQPANTYGDPDDFAQGGFCNALQAPGPGTMQSGDRGNAGTNGNVGQGGDGAGLGIDPVFIPYQHGWAGGGGGGGAVGGGGGGGRGCPSGPECPGGGGGGGGGSSAVPAPGATGVSFQTGANTSSDGNGSVTLAPILPIVPLSQTFEYTGALQSFTVPSEVTSVVVSAIGAQGGGGGAGGGNGAGVEAPVAVTPGESLTIAVGGAGGFAGCSDVHDASTCEASAPGGSAGGAPQGGGGPSGAGSVGIGTVGYVVCAGGGGGGATTVTGAQGTIIAGGGGGGGQGGGAGGVGGDGGAVGSPGGTSLQVPYPPVPGGGGGGASAAGTGGTYPAGLSYPSGANGADGAGSQGGPGGTVAGGCSGGGGGGGTLGGGGGAAEPPPAIAGFDYSAGGGGGSSSGPAGATFTTGTGTGNGQVTITWDPPASPDAQIRVGDAGPFVGAGVFSPAAQRVAAQVAPGSTVDLEVRVVNAGGADGAFALDGPSSVDGFAARYVDGDQDVTDAVQAGTYTTPLLGAASAHTIAVRVTAPSAEAAATSLAIVARSTGDPGRVDEVDADLRTGTATGAVATPLARTGTGTRGGLTAAALLVAWGTGLVGFGRHRRRGQAHRAPGSR